ncbi:metal-dependent hydrolase [Chryseobacterium sp. Leaf180]|uniref:endonuclease/exonuclease/phosphatase family protein n=1 Tax=Chryseobacterium sp. Leaf180 TaxID=1736289 RepID=UPI0006F76BED|nr:endonuclease/exonuclease/phosphatase family protein [Chryseobacterium sp. Leaf180]KQR95152.1 metal-dependent hydrolase [Chryseobacterium sp. Leaf180]
MRRAHIFLFIHFSIFVLLVCTLLNAYISLQSFPYFNFLSIVFPYLLCIHIILTLILILKKRKIAWLAIVSAILFYMPAKRWVRLSFAENQPQKNKLQIKVLSYNVKYGSKGWPKIRDYIRSQDADFIFVQEKDTNHEVRRDLVKYPSVILKTKHKILRQQELMNDYCNGNSFYADVQIHGKIIRIVNVYLEPFRLNKSMLKVKDNLEAKDKSQTFFGIFDRLVPTFRIHQVQVEKIRRAVENSPYPVIMAGDFNAAPNSWEYYHLSKDLKDAFLTAGNGSATSFHDYKIPLRLDYIFTSSQLKAVNYKVHREVKLSDHFPVIAEFELN